MKNEIHRPRAGRWRRSLRRWWSGSRGVANPMARWRVLRPTALVTLFVWVATILAPSAQAMRHTRLHGEESRAVVRAALERYNDDLEALRGDLARGDLRAAARLGDLLSNRAQAVRNELVAAARFSGATREQPQTDEDFFAEHHAQLMQRLDLALNSTGAAQTDAIETALKATGQPKKTHTKDFGKLPWRVEKPTSRQPNPDANALAAWLAAQVSPHGKRATDKRVELLPAKAAPTSADLAQTVEVQLTPAIKDIAASLGNDPVQIYSWVRNNVAFIPTFGSAQGSQVTLDKRQGNAFDTASLLIALYRAAGIPSRYVYGTAQIPAGQVMNWVGGAQTASAAIQILGQGGIPVGGVVSGGQVSEIVLEHVWVEAYVDYAPSRGAVNRKPGTWVAMDPSFKQYQYSAGLNLQTNVPFDPNAFLTQAQQGSTFNAQEGWVQGLNPANLQNALTSYQTQLQDYITNVKPDATVADIIGSRDIIVRNDAILLGSLPYKTRAIAGRLSTLPAGLRHQFYYALYQDDFSRSIDSALWNFQADLPTIAGKKVTLAFVPATAADAQAIAALAPKPHADGTPIQSSELPTTLPHSIHVRAQLRVEGQVVEDGGVFGIGDELAGRGGFTTLDLTDSDLTDDDTLIAGQQSALGISVFGISTAQLGALKARLAQTQVQLQSQDFSNFTGETYTGDILTATIWSYFASLQVQSRVASTQANMLDYPGLSYGFFHAAGQPIQLYGIVTTGLRMVGVLMDVGHLRHLRWEKRDDPRAWIRYNRLSGQYASAMESSIPEQFFNDPARCNVYHDPASSLPPCVQGISAASAIVIAQNQGQRVYTITQANAATALPAVQASADVKQEIQDAIAAGKEVSVHAQPITTASWHGTGYIVIDPQTGAGAYLVEGAANGGALDFVSENSTYIGFGLFVAGLVAAVAEGIWPLLVAVVALVVAALVFEAAYLEALDNAACAKAIPCIQHIVLVLFLVQVALIAVGAFANALIGLLLGLAGLIYADDLAKTAAKACNVACSLP